MKSIVITGVDGSGKTSFLDKLEESSINARFVRVPKIEVDQYEGDLKKVGLFINKMGEKSDELKSPTLKIISIFSSMLFFEDFYAFQQSHSPKVIFCERHPLIDTAVYGLIYMEYLNQSSALTNDLEIGEEEGHVFEKIAQKVNRNLGVDQIKNAKGLLLFLKDWFSDAENFKVKQLSKLFNIALPDEVYFLNAPTEVLYQRISSRSNKEVHETKVAMERMKGLYTKVLEDAQINFKSLDTSDWEPTRQLVDSFTERFG